MLQSPLRYPGGKAKLFERVATIISKNKLFSFDYVEPFAGGAGLALRLLSSGFVERVHLNDWDPAIYSFWRAALDRPDEFCERIMKVPLTTEEWEKQKQVYKQGSRSKIIDLGFATFFLNRTNRSGIVDGAGPIGGFSQNGTWKLDARFNKTTLIDSIQFLRNYRHQIVLSREDATIFVGRHLNNTNEIIYLDPPYYVKGHRLYRNFYEHGDHVGIAQLLRENLKKHWIVSYDDVPAIRAIYDGLRFEEYDLQYSAASAKSGSEVMFFSDAIR